MVLPFDDVIVACIHMIKEVVVVLHHACWQQVVSFVVEDVVKFSSLDLKEMWQQCLNELQTMLDKLLNLLIPVHVITHMFKMSLNKLFD